MFKRFIPFAHANNIYEIPIDFYLSYGIKYLFVDLDNTLDSYRSYDPKPNAIDLFAKLNDAHITPYIISNNRGERVRTYANKIGAKYLPSTRKPFSYKIRNLMKENNISSDEVMFVGDQLITDVLAAKGAGIKVIWCDKLVKEDQFTTHINRFFEKFIKKYHKKRNNIIEWRTLYGKSN